MLFGKTKNKRLAAFRCAAVLFAFAACVPVAGCQTKEQKIEAKLERCRITVADGEFQKAVDCYTQASKTNGQIPAWIQEIGAEMIFKRCGELRKKDDFENFAACYEAVTVLTPARTDAYFLAAHGYFESSRNLSRIIDEPDAQKAQTNRKKAAEQLQKSELLVKKGLERNPADAWGNSIYGDVLSKNGKTSEAIPKYRAAVQIEPEKELYRINLARAEEKEAPDDALENYRAALRINPSSKLALYYLGSFHYENMRACEAFAAFVKLKTLDADYEDASEKLRNLREKFDIGKCSGKTENNSGEPGGAGAGTGDKP